MRFWLGTHKAVWLARLDVELMVSRRTLYARRNLPRARADWALDSGGFSELSLHGGWTVAPEDYAEEVRNFSRKIGRMVFASQQDWMCEPTIVTATGLSVREHQERTVENFLSLSELAPEVPWLPVLQGWGVEDYLSCLRLYADAGVDLTAQPLVGVGTVCRRQHTAEGVEIMRQLHAAGLRLHAFGFKLRGLREAARYLASADSMAWSFAARREDPLPGCPHKACNNCAKYALLWREKAIEAIKADNLDQGESGE